MNQSEILAEIESRTGIKPTLARRVLATTGDIIKEKVPKGEAISIPGVVRISFGVTVGRAKGEEYVGFGGEVKTAEKASKDKLRVTVGYPGGKNKLMPTGVAAKRVIAAKKG